MVPQSDLLNGGIKQIVIKRWYEDGKELLIDRHISLNPLIDWFAKSVDTSKAATVNTHAKRRMVSYWYIYLESGEIVPVSIFEGVIVMRNMEISVSEDNFEELEKIMDGAFGHASE